MDPRLDEEDDRAIGLDAALADGLIERVPAARRISPLLRSRLEALGEVELRRREAARRARLAARLLSHLS